MDAMSEVAEKVDVSVVTTAPDGNTEARKGKVVLYDNSGVFTVWINTDGSTAWQQIDEKFSGNDTLPARAAFLAQPSSKQSNIAVGSDVDIALGTEVFDQGGDFASSIFTAPVTGKYQLNFSVLLEQMDTAATSYTLKIVTSNRSYAYRFYANIFAADATEYTVSISHLCDMDANDTAKVVFKQLGGAAQTDIDAGDTRFSGFLAV